MVESTRDIGEGILEGIRQLKRGEHGRIIAVPAIASIRENTGLSQSRLAELLGVAVRTLQEWEQGRRKPSGAARTLLLNRGEEPARIGRRCVGVGVGVGPGADAGVIPIGGSAAECANRTRTPRTPDYPSLKLK